MANIKQLFYLFIIFMFIVSDVFNDSVLSRLGESTTKGRHPTTWGTVLQGIFLVVGYSIIIHLENANVL